MRNITSWVKIWKTSFFAAVCFSCFAWGNLAMADDFDAAPILYRETPAKNVISAFEEQLKSGAIKLKSEEHTYFLRDALAQLKVPLSSQVLVFSKTSLQRHKIEPSTPRSIFFNDDVYIGFCQGSPVLEVSAVDPQLGTAFYTMDMNDGVAPVFERQSDNCLICHASSHTRQIPGHMVRSVYTDVSGLPILAMGSHRIDHTSPFEKRWGGWYVSGTHGQQKHLGNLTLTEKMEPEQVDTRPGQNQVTLRSFFDAKTYLSPHSDIVALMVLEHQGEGHNLITRASFQCRMALHQQTELNRELGQPEDKSWESTKSRIRSASEDLLKYLLFCEEAPLTEKVQGVSGFAEEFTARGPADPQGRSLRDFDLEKRLFKYPCSYLVYTEAFQKLPQPVLDHIWRRMHEVVTFRDESATFKHLSREDRMAIREILLATCKQLPDYWREPVPPTP
jgi:hypothetical protein